ncbi:MAG TPA: hypothetical protein VMC83_17680 [Streptosporangiaceae bacterium]|nr:hypothetical protein [Streptosporangiaceae bacterium]
MDVGRYLNISAIADNGVLSAVAALVVLIVLFWALSSPFWKIPDEPATTAPTQTDPRSHAGAADAPAPIPRTVRVGTYQAGPRHAAGPVRVPRVTGAPPWGPAPRPPGLPPVA